MQGMRAKARMGGNICICKHDGDYVKTGGCKEGKYKSKSECLDKTRYKTYKYDYRVAIAITI
jgi:hypothetical protein